MMEGIDIAGQLIIFNDQLETLVKLNDSYSQDLKNNEHSLQLTKDLLEKEIEKNFILNDQLNLYKEQIDQQTKQIKRQQQEITNQIVNNSNTSNNNNNRQNQDQQQQADDSINTNSKSNDEYLEIVNNNREIEKRLEEEKEKNTNLSEKFSNTRSELEHSLLKIESLEIACSNLDKSLSERSETSQKTIDCLEREIKDVRDSLQQKDDYINQLQLKYQEDNLNQAKLQEDTLNQAKVEYQNKIESIENDYKSKQDGRINEQVNQLKQEYESKIKQLQTDFESSDSNGKELFQQDISRVQSENNELKQQLATLKRDIEKQQDDYSFVETEKQQALRDLEESKSSNRMWKESMDRVESEKEQVTKIHSEEIEKLKLSFEKEIALLQQSCAKLSAELESTGNNREEEITRRLAESLDKYEIQRNQDLESFKRGSVEMVNLSEQLEDTKKKLIAKETQIKQIQDNYEKFKQSKELELKGIILDKDTMIEDIKQDIQVKQNQIDDLEIEKLNWLNNSNNNINVYNDNSNSEQNENSLLANDYKLLDNKYKELVKEIEEREDELQVLRNTIKHLEKTIEENDIRNNNSISNRNHKQQDTSIIDEKIQKSVKMNQGKYSKHQSIYKLSNQKYLVNSIPLEITIDDKDNLLGKANGSVISIPLESFFKKDPLITGKSIKFLLVLLAFYIVYISSIAQSYRRVQ